MLRRTSHAAAALLAVGALMVSMTGCTSQNDDLSERYEAGSNEGFISSDGRIEVIPIGERGESVVFTGTEVDGSNIRSDDYAGKVLVLNFWYAGCGPCRAEAPYLTEVHEDTESQGVNFLGVNILDGSEQAASFEETYGITYPSLLARDDAELKLSFATWTTLNSTPTTLVLDKRGRVAARFYGALDDASVLRAIVHETVAEGV